MKPLVPWHAKPCSLINIHRRYRITCYLHQEGKLNEISHTRGQVKEEQSRYSPGVAQRVPGRKGSQIS